MGKEKTQKVYYQSVSNQAEINQFEIIREKKTWCAYFNSCINTSTKPGKIKWLCRQDIQVIILRMCEYDLK